MSRPTGPRIWGAGGTGCRQGEGGATAATRGEGAARSPGVARLGGPGRAGPRKGARGVAERGRARGGPDGARGAGPL